MLKGVQEARRVPKPPKPFPPGHYSSASQRPLEVCSSSSDMGRPSKTFPMADPAGDEPKRDSGREKPPKGSFHSVAKGIGRVTKFGKYLNGIFPSFHVGTDIG